MVRVTSKTLQTAVTAMLSVVFSFGWPFSAGWSFTMMWALEATMTEAIEKVRECSWINRALILCRACARFPCCPLLTLAVRWLDHMIGMNCVFIRADSMVAISMDVARSVDGLVLGKRQVEDMKVGYVAGDRYSSIAAVPTSLLIFACACRTLPCILGIGPSIHWRAWVALVMRCLGY